MWFPLHLVVQMMSGPMDTILGYVFPHTLYTTYNVPIVVLLMHASLNVGLACAALSLFITVYTALNAVYQRIFNTTSNVTRIALRTISVLALLLFAVCGCISVLFYRDSLEIYWMWMTSRQIRPMASLDLLLNQLPLGSLEEMYHGVVGTSSADAVLDVREL